MNRKSFLAAAVVVVALVVAPSVRAQEDPCAGKADALQAAIDARGAKWAARRPRAITMTGLKLMPIKAPPLAALTLAAAATLPKSFDWRQQGAVSGIRDQGACGSCWAFAMTQALESQVMMLKPGSPDVRLSEQVMLSCSGAGSCDGGRMDADFLASDGLPPEEDYPYAAVNGRCDDARPGWKARAYRIGGWNTVSAELDAMKDALVNYGPLPTVLDLRKDFKYYESGVYSYIPGTEWGCQGPGGKDDDDWGWHAVLIVGYDDDAQCFIVKNSWGSGWGEKGYFRIAYSELATKAAFGKQTLVYLPLAASRATAPARALPAQEEARPQDEEDLNQQEREQQREIKASRSPGIH